MLPRKLHLEQVNRFHDKMKSLGEKVDQLKGNPKAKSKLNKTLDQWMVLFKMWEKLDDMAENIKDTIDSMENE